MQLMLARLSLRRVPKLICVRSTAIQSAITEEQHALPKFNTASVIMDDPQAHFRPMLPSAAAMLHVTLPAGAQFTCKPKAVVGCSTTLRTSLTLAGGLFAAIARKLSGGPFFLQTLSAIGGAGDAMVSPKYLGQVIVSVLNNHTDLFLRRGCFLAHSEGIRLNSRFLRTADAGFMLRARGKGQLALSGYGAVAVIELSNGEDYVLSASHVVAWEGSLRVEPLLRSCGFLRRITRGRGTY